MQKKSQIVNPKSKILFVAILLLAFFFRFYRLADYPLGIFFDPAINGLDAIRLMQRGGPVIFFPTNGGREAFFMYLLIPFIWLFGTIPFSIRIVTASISLLTVAFLIGFLFHIPNYKSLFEIQNPLDCSGQAKSKIQNWNFWLATLGGLALATSYWHIAISRLGQRPILVPMFSIPLFWFFLKGWATGRRRWFILAGILMGLEGHTYSAARLLPVILVLALLPEIRRLVSKQRTPIPNYQLSIINYQLLITNLFFFILTALVVYLPLAWYLLNHPAQFTTRAGSVMVWNFLDAPGDIAAEIGRNLARVGAFFCCQGSPNPIFGLPYHPGSHPLVLPFLLAGLWGSIKDWRLLFPRLAAIWWLVGVLASIVAIEAPHPLRMIVAIAPTAILIALGAIYLAQWLASKKPNWRPERWLLLAVLIILAPMFHNFPVYYQNWLALQSARGVYDYGAIAIRDTIFGVADEQLPIYLPLARFNAPTLLYYLSDAYPRQANLSAPPAEAALVISPERNQNDTVWVRLADNRAIVLPPLTVEGQELIRLAFAGDAQPIPAADGEIIARLARLPVDPVRFVEQPEKRLDALFGPLRLTGATYPAEIDPTAPLPVTLFWQAAEQTVNEYEVLVHLVDDSHRAWGAGDARPNEWVYPTSFWRPNIDNIAAQHWVNLQPGLWPGRYWLAVSVFDAVANQRLPLTAAAGESPDTLFIGPLKVPLPQIEQIPGSSPVTFGQTIQLKGYKIDLRRLKAEQTIQIDLRWRALATPDRDYTVFIHLLDEMGNLVAGNDSPPLAGRYPTTIWTPGEEIADPHRLSIPGHIAPGQYHLAMGLYYQPTGERLALQLPNGQADSQGRLILEPVITVGP